MLKIGDFSKLSKISIRMLRHYAEIGLILPEEVDKFTGYRYYSETQLPAAAQIQVLKNMGFGLAAIGNILKVYDDPEKMQQFLQIRRKELEDQELITRQRLKLLDNTLHWIRKEGNMMDYNVTLKTLPERYVASVRRLIPAYDQESILWHILNEETAQQNIQPENPSLGMAIFHDEGYKESDVDIEIQISVAGHYKDTENVCFKTVPQVQIASGTYQGSYEQITRVNEAVAKWIKENEYEFDGASFCIYHVSPYDAKTPEDMVTEVCYPVKKKQV